jgi:hypothetical protein
MSNYINMVSGTLLHAGLRGAEDRFLYGNPKMTYFKNVFTKGRNFACEYSKIPKLNDNIQFGDTFKVEIPHSGDLLSGIYIDFKLSDLKRKVIYTQLNLIKDESLRARFTSYVNGIGFNIIKEIKLYIGGNLIQVLNGELIFMINELHSSYNKTRSFYHMTKYYNTFSVGNHNLEDVRCNLQLPFYFSKDPGQYIPLCSLTSSKVELHICLRTLDECLARLYNIHGTGDTTLIPGLDGYKSGENIGSHILPDGIVPSQYEKYEEDVEGNIEYFDIIVQTLFLDPADQKLFRMCSKLEYLIELYHIGNQDIIENPTKDMIYSFDLVSKHPTKYLFWVLQRKDIHDDNYYQNYSYDYSAKYDNGFYTFNIDKHLIKNVEIIVNNTSILDGIDAIFLTNTQKYERFTGSILYPIYLYNFALSPHENRPTGTFNMSLFNKKQFRISLCDPTNFTNENIKQDILFRYYTSYYNILTISEGFAGLVYN